MIKTRVKLSIIKRQNKKVILFNLYRNAHSFAHLKRRNHKENHGLFDVNIMRNYNKKLTNKNVSLEHRSTSNSNIVDTVITL